MDWTSDTVNLESPGRCRLFELPAELRVVIFTFALTSDKTVVTYHLDDYQRDSLEEAIQPPLTAVSRQVRCETLPIWYGCNRFVFHTQTPKVDETRQWLSANAIRLAMLKQVSFWVRRFANVPGVPPAYGALGINLDRDAEGLWKVSDAYDWVTVMRRPRDLNIEAKGIIDHAKRAIDKQCRGVIDTRSTWNDILHFMPYLYYMRQQEQNS
ncbi:hypothetical protein LTR56_026344 [Elasticomyces elasticus]|nr:hypothetical protein LTR56_026344 [Elasticomyces elasticus]KAK3663880.1 hypothetical protein LTR22_005341 [Elasticomyces elasticus]KAK4902980.1 hypothetical protein LTR49_026959 [Elasticomyces elasticus]KAK5736990.1 hypothetical protein LTS12_026003 [Elasticomyces elasticus]